MNLETIDVAPLDVVTAVPDLRRDLHVFVDYVRSREVKRSHRGNALSKADAKRLARLVSDPDAGRDVDEAGSSAWIDFVDKVAFWLGFIHYDTKGEYAGYTSQEPSFPDNFIEFRAKPYEQFLAAKAAKQESTLLELLIRQGQGSASEFYRRSELGRLDGFNHWGSALGVMPMLDFTAVRRFLLGLLAECPSDLWLSTSSLVDYLKKHHRYFLIPAKPGFKNARDSSSGRYGNFHESKEEWGHEIDVHESDPDGFERVEGRYVERFLEGVPLLLRYGDVAYTRKPPGAIFPSLGSLQAFRVSDRLGRALAGRIVEPTGHGVSQLRRPCDCGSVPGGRSRPACTALRNGVARHVHRLEADKTEGRGCPGRFSRPRRHGRVAGARGRRLAGEHCPRAIRLVRAR